MKTSGKMKLKLLRIYEKVFATYWYKSAFFTIMQRFSLVFFGFVSYLLLIRILNTSQMGVWALYLGIATTFEMTKYALLKNGFVVFFQTAKDKKEKVSIASSSLILNVLYTAIFTLLIIVFAKWFGHYWKAPDLPGMLFLYIPLTIILIPFGHLEFLQQANMSFKGIFAAYFTRQGIFFLMIIISSIWYSQMITLDLLVIFQIVSLIFGTLVSWISSRRFIHGIFSPSFYWIKKTFNYGKYIYGSGVCSNIFGTLDRYMTALFMSSTAVAYYDVSARVNNLIDIPTTAAADILFPKSARASFEEGPSKVKYIYERMVGILVALLLPLSILVFIFAGKIILIIAGPDYLPAALIIRIAMLYAFLRPVQIQASNVLNSINKPNITFYINLAILTFNLLVNYFLIRSFGFMGAAYGSLITMIFSFSLSFYLLRKAVGVSLKGIAGYALSFYQDFICKSLKAFNLLQITPVKNSFQK